MLNATMLACRVNWGRNSALKARWTEEIELLKEEMKRTTRFCVYEQGRWMEKAEEWETCASQGFATYARRCVSSRRPYMVY